MAGRRKSRKTGRWPGRLRMPALPSVSLPDWNATRTGLVVGAWVVAAGAVAAAWVLGVPRLEAYASAHQATDEVQVRFLASPTWVEGDFESKLQEIAASVIDTDPLGRESLVTAREKLLATGWFDEIMQVRRVDPSTVEVDARFAQPFAIIRDRTTRKDHLVDPRGRLLPKHFPEGAAVGFTVIRGARFGHPGRPGRAWPGADVTAALQVLHMMHDRPWRSQVTEVDVTDYLQTSSIRLLTDRGCVIVWGRSPGDESGSEVPAARKIRYLDYHSEQYGHIDRGFLTELDITGDVVIGR